MPTWKKNIVVKIVAGKECVHNKHKAYCKDCGGSQICHHSHYRKYCRDCKGSQICPHDCRKTICIECKGSSINVSTIERYTTARTVVGKEYVGRLKPSRTYKIPTNLKSHPAHPRKHLSSPEETPEHTLEIT